MKVQEMRQWSWRQSLFVSLPVASRSLIEKFCRPFVLLPSSPLVVPSDYPSIRPSYCVRACRSSGR